MAGPGNPKKARKAILEVVQNQIRDGTPPETRRTLERLIKQGYSREEALNMIGCVVVSEIYDVLKHKRPYDEAGFVRALQALPRMPWEETTAE